MRKLPPIAVLGAGGHGQVVADILRLNPTTANRCLVFLDDDEEAIGTRRMGIPIVGRIGELGAIEHAGVIIGIGGNRIRFRLASTLAAMGEEFITAVHPRAIVAPGVSIGAGSVLVANAVVNTGSTIGKHAVVNTSCTVGHHCQIADFAHVAPGVNLGGGATIAEGAFVGIGAIVMPQRNVGAWSTVGAGSLVHGDVSAGFTVVGTPARLLEKQGAEIMKLESWQTH